MHPHELICTAIKARHLVQFYYDGGIRIVEPHMIATNEAGHHCLSAWFLSGYSKSGRYGWRDYLLSEISNVAVLKEEFAGPRPGYRASSGKKFPRVYCRL